MDQPWESLDVDDSDLCSFLHPNRPFPHFAPCSTILTAVSVPSRSPTPDPTPIPVPPAAECSGQKTEGKWRNEGKIPGPAGEVQSAMRRRAEKDFDQVEDEEGIRGLGTQEYLRRAVEGGGNQEGFDFEVDDCGSTWVRAVDFVRERGLVEGDGVSIGMPLCNIKRGAGLDKVSQVVALVKSCTPNGLGDLLVILKDPTGTISASIHRNVLLDEGFGKVIAPGAVLILQKVAVFSHARSSCYLNITLNNIVQVISKDGRHPLSTRKEPTSVVNDSSNSGDESFQTGERNRGDTMSSFRDSENEAENDFRCALSQQYKDTTRQSHASVCPKRRTISTDASTQREPLSKSNDVESRIGITRTIPKSRNDNVRGIFASLQDKLCSNSASSTFENSQDSRDGSRVEAVANDKGGNTNGKENQREASTQRTSIPEWTDEQLDVLLDFD